MDLTPTARPASGNGGLVAVSRRLLSETRLADEASHPPFIPAAPTGLPALRPDPENPPKLRGGAVFGLDTHHLVWDV